MKKLIAFLALSLTVSAFAQVQIEINSDEVHVNAPEAILVRTNRTPNKVKVTFTVPMSNTVCQRYDSRVLSRTVMVHCGTDYRIEPFFTTECFRRNPHNGQCLATRQVRHERRIPIQRMCPTVQHYTETFCAQHGTAVTHEADSMKLNFKKLPRLGDSEADSFIVRAHQENHGGNNVVWEMSAVQTTHEYKIGRRKVLGLFKTDGFTVELK